MKSNRKKLRMGSRGTKTKVMRAFRKYIAKFAADRPKYLAAFFALWEGAARDVTSLADQLLQRQEIDFTQDIWERILKPYDTLNLMIYARLMDKLDLEEEERYLAACANLNSAWQKFFAFVLGRHSHAAEVIARIETARQAVHDATVPLFTGEALPVLTPAWANAYLTLENGFNDFAEALRT